MTFDSAFNRRVALITGGGEGIGRAIAKAFVSRGARVAICGRRRGLLETTAGEIGRKGMDVLPLTCDVTRKDQVELVVKETVNAFGRLDILVNNAGMSGRTPIGDPDDSQWLNILQVNLTGTYYCAKAAVPHMISGGFGRIVNLSSVLGQFGVPGYLAYCTAKHGLLGFTKSLALEVIDHGVTVNAVCPTWVDTDMARKGIEETAEHLGISSEAFRAQAIQALPMKRMAEADEIAALTVFLCSGAAGAITGQAINVCGGSTAGIA